jgi:hypothetical protein
MRDGLLRTLSGWCAKAKTVAHEEMVLDVRVREGDKGHEMTIGMIEDLAVIIKAHVLEIVRQTPIQRHVLVQKPIHIKNQIEMAKMPMQTVVRQGLRAKRPTQSRLIAKRLHHRL